MKAPPPGQLLGPAHGARTVSICGLGEDALRLLALPCCVQSTQLRRCFLTVDCVSVATKAAQVVKTCFLRQGAYAKASDPTLRQNIGNAAAGKA